MTARPVVLIDARTRAAVGRFNDAVYRRLSDYDAETLEYLGSLQMAGGAGFGRR